MITIHTNGKDHMFPDGTTFETAAAAIGAHALGAAMGGRLYALGEKLSASGEVEFLGIASEEGSRIYARSASFLLVRAVRELFPGARVVIDHSIHNALYCRAEWERRLTPADLHAVEDRMREITARDEPFTPILMDAGEARALFERDGRTEVAALIPEGGEFTAHRSGGFADAWYGPLAPSTGYVRQFRLQSYIPGFVLIIPHMYHPHGVPEFAEMPKLSAVYNESSAWERSVGAGTLADLNNLIRGGSARALVRMAEICHERKLSAIAEIIVRERRRVILVAGPSSSGKTTFAHRLTAHLNTYALQPVALSLDDYYRDRRNIPKDVKLDLESIEALDIPLFEEQITALLAGDAVKLAKFDFLTGKSFRSEAETRVRDGQPLIIEGINGLNDALTRFIPGNTKFRIFVSALTQLNIDNHNRIATTDVRLLRRMVRDSLYRGHSAENTFKAWPAVHAAEFRNIFPYQENADAIFNSALVYEIAALKPHAMPMLEAIPQGSPARLEAERLLGFLSLAEDLPCPDEIPPTSIVREFIGGCTFYI